MGEIRAPRLKNGTFIDKKVIVSGDIVEVYEYETSILKGYQVDRIGRASVASTEEQLLNRQEVSNRAKRDLRRIINSNVHRWIDDEGRAFPPIFITLTFAENMTDLNQANKEFRDFLLRLNYRLNGTRKNTLKYVVAIEFQKRGAVHYHCVFFNLPYIEANEFAKLWGQGFIRMNKVTEVDNIGSYVCKYIGKEIEDDRLKGRKCYFTSRGLLKPLELTKEKEIDQMSLGLSPKHLRYVNTFENKFIGKIAYSQYNMTQ